MQARIGNPALDVPGAMQALVALSSAAARTGVSATTLELAHLRASQINGCSVCVAIHARDLEKAGESTDKIIAVGAWRDMPYFSAAERAALALAEEVTRLADRSDAVPDSVWDEAQLAGLVLSIASVNLWNRVNIATRQQVA